MYGLVKASDQSAVYAVAPGVWFHVTGEQLAALRKAKVVLNDGVVQVLLPTEISALKMVLLPA